MTCWRHADAVPATPRMLASRPAPNRFALVSAIQFSVVESLSGVDAAAWNALTGGMPILSHAFLDALHETGCASVETGWHPQYIVGQRDGKLAAAMPLYLKSHSYGE